MIGPRRSPATSRPGSRRRSSCCCDGEVRVRVQPIGNLRGDYRCRGLSARNQCPRRRLLRIYEEGGARPAVLVDRWWRGSRRGARPLREAARLAAQGEVSRATLPYWTGDGSERLFDFAMHPIRDGRERSGSSTQRVSISLSVREPKQRYGPAEAEEHRIALGLQHGSSEKLVPGRGFGRCSVRGRKHNSRGRRRLVRRLCSPEWFRRAHCR